MFVSGAYLIATNLVWIAYDTRPPFWDMAGHQSAALRIYEAFRTTSLLEALRSVAIGLTGYYPPLYQTIVALFYAVFGRTADAALWANVPAIVLLLVATYGIGKTVMSPAGAAGAAVLVNFYPLMLWLSRETMMGYWLTSMVALAMWLLVARGLGSRNWSMAFGVVCGLGMLTKWTFALFIVLPFLWFARRNIRHAAVSAFAAAIVAGYWYVPQLTLMSEFLGINTADGVGEGDPNRFSFQAIAFYVRALEGYQLFLPLFVAFLAGAFLLSRRFDPRWTPIVFWILSGWFGLMLFQNKDPRYSVPLLPAVALITAKVFEKKQVLLAALLPFLIFQHYLVSFGIGPLPQTVVLMEGVAGPLTYDWNVYTQSYFGLWGRPANENWHIDEVLGTVASRDGSPVRLGIVPDIARFDTRAFEFHVALRRQDVSVNPLWAFNEEAISDNDFILVSEGNYGAPGSFLFSPDRQLIVEYMLGHPDSFRAIDTFELPTGEMIQLYQVGA